MDQAPYSLCERNAVINGVTKDRIHVIVKSEDRFNSVKRHSLGQWRSGRTNICRAPHSHVR